MSLRKYREKRDFSQSPEPSGDESLRAQRAARAGKARFFCVQKHLASHLHYDFRLEYDGVLLSWAVPKGPSLDPKTKRLAMQVEDHPIEYGTFEGVIPSGYGAGIVMLWDEGTWTPQVTDVDAAMKKGDLKFTLDGYKLKGSWALVRTSGRGARPDYGSKPSWLLIKHRDEWAGPVDITEFAPLSVKSRGDFADILAQEHPDVWESHRPAQTGEAGRMFERIVARALEMRTSMVPETAQAAGAASPGARSRARSAGGTGASDRNSSTRKTASRASQPRTRAAAATKKRKAASPRSTGHTRKR